MSLLSRMVRALPLILLAIGSFSASAADFQEGRDYVKVAGIPEAKGGIVREFFSYNCPHCYYKDPLMQQTAALLKGKLDFERTPVGAGRPSWILSQEAYYLAQKFRITDQVHGNIFNRIHEQHQAFERPQQLKDFFLAQGVNEQELNQTLGSADSKLALANYDTQTQLSGIRGVPSLLVNGKYLITSKSSDPKELAALILYLNREAP
ncbi:thiol:disulfide interchange protein DsbA/DsbL [Shewanella carassii]|uniref:Thiol:disulfide interchange protein n=1 Tax=Shewanella carassii TaxID=1987584 RepID=A0ABQ1SW64_9GAMM|nr:thiol:disulfide interchange protein DsbA/DsbL [Shewanella carassii]GGE67958.1 thiol:disulfide interchange protein [Shewanella carassii]